MTKNSQQSLSERIQQQLEQDLADAKSRTETLLSEHVSSLQQVLSAELNTTKSGIRRQREALSALYQSALDDERKHQSELNRLRRKSLTLALWMLWLPLLTSGLVSIVLLASSGLWTWAQLKELEQKEFEHLAQIQRLTSEFCATPAGLKHCRTK